MKQHAVMPLKVALAWLLFDLVPIRRVQYWLLNRHWQLIYWRAEDQP